MTSEARRSRDNDDNWTIVRTESFRGRDEFIEFRENYKKKIATTGHLFKIDPNIVSIERNRTRGLIFEHLAQLDKIIDWIRTVERNKEDLGEIVIEKTRTPNRGRETYRAGNWRYLKYGKRADDTPIYLKDSGDGLETSWTWLRKYFRDYAISTTTCDVLPNKYDPDYPKTPAEQLAITEGSCTQRYEAWRKLMMSDMPYMFSSLGSENETP